MRRSGIGLILLTAVLLAAAAYVVPRGIEARSLLSIEDDPGRIAERALDKKFDATFAKREIEAALAGDDADLAKSFIDLAEARHVTLEPKLVARVNAASVQAASAQATAESFALGLVTGEPNDMASLAGTAFGDLFVFGDIRDAVREGGKLVIGEEADRLVLGLACVGLAITAGTYASPGASAPARVGLSVAKAARKTGRLGAGLAASMSRMLRGVVDWGRLKKALLRASISQPALAVHAAREAVKVERAGGLVHLARNVGRVQAKAGTQAALESLKIAESPREMGLIAKLAEKQGGKTRAILKTVGRGAIVLTGVVFDLGLWIVGALFTLFALVSSLKSTTERVALRVIRHRKERRRLKDQQRYAALTVR